MRPIMTRAELASHQVGIYGRDYSLSCDGWDDMEVASRAGWTAISGWGLDGWDLGDWPLVVISVRSGPAKVETFGLTRPGQVHDVPSGRLAGFLAGLRGRDTEFYEVLERTYEMRQTVEGDTTAYRFDGKDDLAAAIDYLFIWYGLGHEYNDWLAEGLSPDKRAALDAGMLRVPERFRGEFSWARLEVEKGAR